MASIEPRPSQQPQTHEMDPIQTTLELDRPTSNPKDNTGHLGAAEALGELAQSVGNPNIRYEDQADYIEGGFGWAIVVCKSVESTLATGRD